MKEWERWAKEVDKLVTRCKQEGDPEITFSVNVLLTTSSPEIHTLLTNMRNIGKSHGSNPENGLCKLPSSVPNNPLARAQMINYLEGYRESAWLTYGKNAEPEKPKLAGSKPNERRTA